MFRFIVWLCKYTWNLTTTFLSPLKEDLLLLEYVAKGDENLPVPWQEENIEKPYLSRLWAAIWGEKKGKEYFRVSTDVSGNFHIMNELLKEGFCNKCFHQNDKSVHIEYDYLGEYQRTVDGVIYYSIGYLACEKCRAFPNIYVPEHLYRKLEKMPGVYDSHNRTLKEVLIKFERTVENWSGNMEQKKLTNHQKAKACLYDKEKSRYNYTQRLLYGDGEEFCDRPNKFLFFGKRRSGKTTLMMKILEGVVKSQKKLKTNTILVVLDNSGQCLAFKNKIKHLSNDIGINGNNVSELLIVDRDNFRLRLKRDIFHTRHFPYVFIDTDDHYNLIKGLGSQFNKFMYLREMFLFRLSKKELDPKTIEFKLDFTKPRDWTSIEELIREEK